MIITEGKTLQQVSDEIAASLIAQGKRCFDERENACLYGDTEGNHCAVGLLLPEDDFNVMSFEGNVSTLLNHYGFVGPNTVFIAEHREFLGILQKIHDTSHDDSRKQYVEDAERCGINMYAWRPWVDMAKPIGENHEFA